MKTLKQNEKYHSAGNTIKGNVFPTLLTLSHSQGKQNPHNHALKTNFMWTENQLFNFFIKKSLQYYFIKVGR